MNLLVGHPGEKSQGSFGAEKAKVRVHKVVSTQKAVGYQRNRV